jgi:hypothetical protein
MGTGVIPVILYHGAIPEIESIASTSNSITVCWYSEGSDYTYNVYYSSTKNVPCTLSNSTPFTDQVYGNCYTITGLSSSRIYYVTITSVDTDSIEGPQSVVWGIKTTRSS